MSTHRETKKEKKIHGGGENKSLSWRDKIELANKEEQALVKEIDDLKSWTNMIGAMKDQQLKEYITNRPDYLRSLKIKKPIPSSKRGSRVGKSKASYTGIMASVWKFHKDDDEDVSVSTA
ncbi:hypothetical protein RJ641_029296 [Dillenia turbinata]|uniref:Uncharacterized protein n=1 Tax=Dillenia turbinata TaxID=194707 RepID=A0AAN8ZMU5_9MAGN